MRLAGKIALVTGENSGIDKAVIWALAREGAKIAFVFEDGSHTNERLVTELELDQHEAVAIPCDLKQAAECDRAIERVLQRWEKVDILVNNLGIVRKASPAAACEEAGTDVVSRDLEWVYDFCEAVARPMASAGYGRVVNTSGVAVALGNGAASECDIGAGGVEEITRRLAGNLAKHGITVNAVAAGFIRTRVVADNHGATGDQLTKRIPVGRFGRPEDVGSAVLFLASDESSYITGHVLAVDGGLSVGGF